MRKRIDWMWERLDHSTWRAMVIGGWLIKSEYVANKMPATSMTFVSDRDHEWCIMPPIVDSAPVKPTVLASDFESSK